MVKWKNWLNRNNWLNRKIAKTENFVKWRNLLNGKIS